jgi:hypothetical protein
VIDLDNEIIEAVVARESIAAATGLEPYRLVVMAALRIFAPGVYRPNGADGQECAWPRVAVGTPPHLPGPKGAFRGPAIAFALVGPDAAAPKGDRYGLPVGGKPAPARVAGGGVTPDRGSRPITRDCLISD